MSSLERGHLRDQGTPLGRFGVLHVIPAACGEKNLRIIKILLEVDTSFTLITVVFGRCGAKVISASEINNNNLVGIREPLRP